MRIMLLSSAFLLALAGYLPGQNLDITWVDVEGGAATLMVTPGGETVLVDTGSPGRRDPERILKAVAAAGKRRIDHLVITHYHSDHFGGAAELAELLPIGTVYDNAEFDGMPEKPPKVYRDFKCEKRVQINPGDKLPIKRGPQDEGLAFEIVCLGTRQTFIAPPAKAAANEKVCAAAVPKDRDGSDNANSVVLLVKFGEFRFFDAGDLTWNQEAKLVCPTNLIGKVDVYQTTHHGLDQSNNPLVLKSIEPRVAIMNNGTTKGCMPEVFANLQEQKSIAAIYQMHKNLRPDGEQNNTKPEYIANSEKECNGNVIQLSVAADGKSYTVSIPATKHSQKFETMPK
jgi:beta-lactamase superfamily II metal-dependent hydrolase